MSGFFQRLAHWWYARLSRQIVAPAVVVTLLFLAALGFVAFRLGQRAVITQVEERNRQLAAQVGQEINTFFQTQLDTLRLLEPPLLNRAAPDGQQAALLALRTRFPYTYNDLRLVDSVTNQTLVVTGTLSQVLQHGVVREAALPTALPAETQAITISPVAFSSITGSPYITLTLPLGDCAAATECASSMTLLAQIDLRSFWTKVDSIRIDSGSVSIVDGNGMVLAHPDRQRVGQHVARDAIAPVFAGYEGTTTYTHNGVTYLAAYSPISNLLGWGVIVEQEQAYALAPVWTIGAVSTLATLLSGACLALLLSSIVGHAVQPVAALSAAASVIAASGDVRDTTGHSLIGPLPANNEIGALANSFTQMIDRLGNAQNDLQRWNEQLEQRVVERTAQLRTVLEVARLSSGFLDEQVIVRTMLAQTERLVAYDTITLMLLDATSTALEIVATYGGNAPLQRRIHALDDLPLNRLVIDRGVPQIVANTDLYPGWRKTLASGTMIGSWLGVPLIVNERPIGVMGLFKQQVGFYGEEEATLMSALASQVAIALAHARLYEDSVQRVERELQVASQIQRHLFPDRAPQWAGVAIASFYRPARETTGDFYAFVSDPAATGTSNSVAPLCLLIGDVSGKSLPAALLMAMARSALYMAASTHGYDPAAALRSANAMLLGEMPRGSFVATSAATFDRATKTCSLVNAAQPAPLLVRGDEVRMLDGVGSHLPLGVIAAPAYSAMRVALQPNDLLVFYTDGVIEAFNHAKEMFGFDRLETIAGACADPTITPQQAVDQIIAAVTAWMGDVAQHDDIALVVVRVNDAWQDGEATNQVITFGSQCAML